MVVFPFLSGKLEYHNNMEIFKLSIRIAAQYYHLSQVPMAHTCNPSYLGG
jgi:hypothetical protein